MARAGGKDPEKLPEHSPRRKRSSVGALSEGARARLRRRAHRRRRLRSDRDARRAARRRRAGRDERAASRSSPAIVSEQDAERVVVGLPLTLRGERGEQARETLAFVEALRGVLAVPVETYDERFTTALAARPAARQTRTPARPPISSRLPRGARARVRRARRDRCCSSRCRSSRRAACATRRRLPPVDDAARSRGCASSSRRGSPARHGRPRGRVREIAIEKRGVTPRLTRTGYLQASGAAVPPPEFRKDWKLSSIEGFLFPGDVRVHEAHVLRAPRLGPARAFRRNWRKVDLRYARSKNLTPYDVLIIASMIEKEAVAPGAEARRGRDLQPPPQPDAARDRRDDPLRTRRAGHGAAEAVRSPERQPVQHPEPARAAADADLEPRARVDEGGGASSGESTTCTSFGSRTASITSSPRASRSSARSRSSTGSAAADVQRISGSTRLVGIIGWPVEHSLSPRMHNAAFEALGLDWAYVALPTPPERLEEAVRGLAALGFAGANVTTPHKLAVTAFCESDAPLGEHARRSRRTVDGPDDGRGGARRPRGGAPGRPRRRRHRAAFCTHSRGRVSSRAEARGRPRSTRPISW